MSKRAPLTDEGGEVRELTGEDLRRFKPAAEVLPPDLLRTMGIKPRGPQKAPTKQATTIRLSPEVMRLELRLPGEEVLEYRPGQYIDILLKDGRRRAFSLATAHQTGGFIGVDLDV